MTELLDHEEVVVRRGERSGLPVVIAVHSTAAGPAVGGCRLWTYPDRSAGLRDALDLSRAMTEKCAIAGLPHGGGKTVVPLPATLLDVHRRHDLMLDVGDLVDSLDGRYAIGEDVGTGTEDMTAVASRTPHVLGLPTGAGEPAEPTAAGVLAAVRAVVDDVAGRRFAVHGLGGVGGRVARRLVSAGATVFGADVDPGRRAAAAAAGVTVLPGDDLLEQEVDVLVPASLGGLLDHAVVDRLRCRAVVGPANNQLAAPSVGAALAERGIVWAPDVAVNAGGAIYVVLRERHGVGHDEAMARVRGIEDTVRSILAEAAASGRTPGSVAADRVAAGTAR